MRAVLAVDAVLSRTSNVLLLLSGIALVAMMLHVSFDVAAKYLFHSPIKSTLDVVTYYYMVALTFLPLAAVERGGGHISVELLTQALPPRWRDRLAVLSLLVSCAFFGVLGAITLGTAIEKFHIGEYVMGTLQLQVWPSRFFVPLGFGLIATVCLAKLVRDGLALFGIVEKDARDG